MGWKRSLLDTAHRTGALRAAGGVFGSRALRVLAYHRVADVSQPGFDTLKANVSASVEEFDAQMAHIADRYTPVGIDAVLAARTGSAQLPDRAVLVTFDDGYRDNLTAALPILEKYEIPALLFLATDHIATNDAFWWDRVAWSFTHSDRSVAELPVVGVMRWSDPQRAAQDVAEALKRVPNAEREAAVEMLPGVLEARPGSDAFSDLLLTWDDVRAMGSRGFSFGAHTCTHPVLSRVEPDRLGTEVLGSRDRLTDELGTAPATFAYPNGLRPDFDDRVVHEVRSAGFDLAFTLVPGPARGGELRSSPFEVRRIYIHHGDDLPRFAAKLAGLPRLAESVPFVGSS